MSRMLVLFLISIVSVNAGRPFFEKTVELVYLEPYVKIEIFCNASGEEPMEYTWYDEHSQEVGLNHNHSIYTRPTESGSFLVMEDPVPKHNGTFTCSAINMHGRSSKIFEYFVLDAGIPFIKNISILDITDTSVLFSVSASRNTGSILINFKEDLDQFSNSSLITTNDDNGFMESLVHMNSLVPGGKYQFQFQAVLENGNYSEKWEIKDVILLPSAPELIFLNLREGTLKIQWDRKFADFRRQTILDYTLTYGAVYRRGADIWEEFKCPTTIIVPPCGTTSYTISDLSKSTYYEIHVKARTATGYGEPSKFKVYIQ